MGAVTWSSETHADAGAAGVSTTSPNDRYAGQSTEIDDARTRTTQRDTKTAQKALPSGQEGGLSEWLRFNRKPRGRSLV
jgi:hypothetical protein